MEAFAVRGPLAWTDTEATVIRNYARAEIDLLDTPLSVFGRDLRAPRSFRFQGCSSVGRASRNRRVGGTQTRCHGLSPRADGPMEDSRLYQTAATIHDHPVVVSCGPDPNLYLPAGYRADPTESSSIFRVVADA